MKGKNSRLLALMLSPVLALVLLTSTLRAQTQEAHTQQTQKDETQAIDKDKLEEAREESREASEVFMEIMKTPDKAIPKELLEKAEAIAVFPDVVKAALIVGGQGGDGVISRRTSSGWGAPVFFKMRGGSFGAQIGAESTDYVLLFMNEGALKGLLEDKFEIGGEVSIAAGPVGRTAAASTNVTLDAGILSYSRSKGAFIGASIKGAQISPQNDLNMAIYRMNAKDILTGTQTIDAAKVPEGVMSFTQTLTNHTRGQSSHTEQAAPAQTVQTAPEQQPVTQPVTEKPVPPAQQAAPTQQTPPNPPASRVESVTYREPRTQNEETPDTRPAPRSLTPIEREVRHELLMLPYYSVFDWIEFQVQPDGTVVLSGFVTSPPDTKSRAEARVKDVEGVERVVNNIEVLPVSPTDDRLRQQLYQQIYSGPLFRYAVGSLNTVHIIVSNGRATLYGVVDSEADKQLAYTRARSVPGLFEVKNMLAVKSRDER